MVVIVVERPNAASASRTKSRRDMERSILDDEPGDHAAALVAKRLEQTPTPAASDSP